jgi:hypothetical protein
MNNVFQLGEVSGTLEDITLHVTDQRIVASVYKEELSFWVVLVEMGQRQRSERRIAAVGDTFDGLVNSWGDSGEIIKAIWSTR